MPHPFTIDKLNDSIKNTKNNSAPGSTNIHYLTLKNLSPNSKTLLLHIFNLILTSGEIPTDWKAKFTHSQIQRLARRHQYHSPYHSSRYIQKNFYEATQQQISYHPIKIQYPFF